MDTVEVKESHTLLEAKALREGSLKLSEYTAFAQNLTFRVSQPLRALLKIAAKAHPGLHAMLIDILQYKPKLIVDADKVVLSLDLTFDCVSNFVVVVE